MPPSPQSWRPGRRASAVVAAVGSTETAEALVKGAVEAFGGLDILVNNAGILRDKSLLKMTDEDFDLVIQVHLRGTFTCVREAYRYFKENGVAGRIITIGSPTGQYGNFGQTNYAAAKAGIVGMVRTWALEMKKAGVTVNAVIPVAATAMTKTIPFFRHDLGFGTADDVAGLITFLASDAAADITGQAIGAGGDRLQLFTHPTPVVTEYKEGGWSYDDLAADFHQMTQGNLQKCGEVMPQLPEELQPKQG